MVQKDLPLSGHFDCRFSPVSSVIWYLFGVMPGPEFMESEVAVSRSGVKNGVCKTLTPPPRLPVALCVRPLCFHLIFVVELDFHKGRLHVDIS